ncbi:MAG TPA: SHOCT domain-containing protein [Candidatus Hydrogenedentes bacterium]|nr:SHOCT domain-containing protein [Candidatus Hydrogenedentota bacterium]HOC73404.1 SHOCT domain-containing protein [Candidatus Hydrogenedentota bacterium]HOH50511.1 SHOCT domain-containing protein [Candidatus Hydrogenedentota bacterium]HQL93246.1 SHOCT domain-containing protein [Candidatus Hydrogenedentota bacterium]
MKKQNISPERKAVYYIGLTLMFLGFLSVGSSFVSFITHFGDFRHMEAIVKSVMVRGFVGVGMVMVGMVLAGIGSRGLAGSGLVLDPQRAREDVEPWARMAGGVIKDAVEETGIRLGSAPPENADNPDFDEKLRKLHLLYKDGIITEEEYLKGKEEILGAL